MSINYLKQGIINNSYYIYAICDKVNNIHIGNIKIGPIRRSDGISDLVTVIGNQNYWKKNVASRAIMILRKEVFLYNGIRKFVASIDSLNIPSLKAYKKAGFKIESKITNFFVHSKDRVNASELSTYENLANEKCKGRVLVRSSSNAYNQALMSSIIANLGADDAAKWSEALVENFARDPKGSDRDQVKAIASGQGDIAIVNSYYIGLLLSSDKEEEINAGESISVFFPNQGPNERGSHINVSGIGLAMNSPNKENALELINYLISDEAQKTYVSNSFEYSVNPNIKPDEIVQKWGEFKRDSLDLNMLGKYRKDAIRIFDKTGWK